MRFLSIVDTLIAKMKNGKRDVRLGRKVGGVVNLRVINVTHLNRQNI